MATRNFFREFVRDVEAHVERLATSAAEFAVLASDERTLYEFYESGLTPQEAAGALVREKTGRPVGEGEGK